MGQLLEKRAGQLDWPLFKKLRFTESYLASMSERLLTCYAKSPNQNRLDSKDLDTHSLFRFTHKAIYKKCYLRRS